MPEISRFFGIIIRMFLEAGEPHSVAHFHAYYGDFVAVFGITPVQLIAGELPNRQRRLVEAWAELHTQELIDDWVLLQSARAPAAIKPLS